MVGCCWQDEDAADDDDTRDDDDVRDEGTVAFVSGWVWLLCFVRGML